MTIQFITRHSVKKHARVVILKPTLKIGKRGNRIGGYEVLGTLRQLDPEFVAQFAKDKELTEQDTLDLEEDAAQLAFNHNNLGDSLDDLNKKILYFSKPYTEALFQLWKQAKEYNIAFCPSEIMHKSLLHKAKAIERKLNELKKEPVNILENIGINIARFDEDEYRKKVQKSCRKLFSQLIKTNLSIDFLCDEFNHIAKNIYKKTVQLKPHFFPDYAANLKRLPFWYNTVAIDLLLLHKKNPLDFLSIDAVAEDWIRLRKENMDITKAITLFKETFNPKEEDVSTMEIIIKNAYQAGFATDNV